MTADYSIVLSQLKRQSGKPRTKYYPIIADGESEMVAQKDLMNPTLAFPIIAGVLALLLAGCATQRYGRMTQLSPGEHASLSCDQISSEIEKAEFFIEDVQRQRSETSGAHVLGALGDFGIGNVMEGNAAEKSGTDRLNELTVLEVEKGCKTDGTAAVSMSANEIRVFVADKTQYGVNEKGRDWAIYFDPSGEVRGKSTGSDGTSYDSGTWEATADNMLCIQYRKWRHGKLRCWQIYNRSGELTYIGKIGTTKSYISSSTWKRGNLENL